MIVLSTTFVPYDQFDLDIILKVTEDQTKFKLALLNGGQNYSDDFLILFLVYFV